jgi:hypothetical protein
MTRWHSSRMPHPVMRLSAYLFLALSLTAIACADLPESDDPEALGLGGEDDKADSATLSTYYTIERDTRRCVAPLCGGWWVARVNQASTKCIGGKYEPACYVFDVDASALGLSDEELANFQGSLGSRVLLRGKLVKTTFEGFGSIGTFRASEGWMAPTDATPSGTFYQVTDSGIRCITTPCFSLTERKLNSTKKAVNITDLIADELVLDAAYTGLGQGAVIVAGFNEGTTLEITQAFQRVVAKQ